MRDSLVEQTISDVMSKQTDISPEVETTANSIGCGTTEFIGTASGYTTSPVIADVDNQLYEVMNIDKEHRSIGILGARTSAGPQIFVVDETIKATNNEIIPIELAHDTEGGGRHGCLIALGASDVPNVKRTVEVALSEIERAMSDVYGSSAGHLELQYTARASCALNKALGAPIGKSFGMTYVPSAAVGLVIADAVVKSAVTDPMGCASPSQGTSFSNEVIFTFSGDSGAVHQAMIVTREVGLQLLSTLDSVEIRSITTPYI